MEKLINDMENYRRESFNITDKEILELQKLSDEFNVVLKHSGEKITLNKEALSSYLTLIMLFKEIEGFNHAINYLNAYNKETK